MPDATTDVIAIRDALRAWIAAILERHKWTAFELGRRAGVDGKTITRYMYDNKIKPYVLSLPTLRALIAVSGVPLPAEVLSSEPAKPAYVEEEILRAALDAADPLMAELSTDERARVLTDVYNSLLDSLAEGVGFDVAVRLARRRVVAAQHAAQRRRR